MKPRSTKISVVTTTFRPGGIDMIVNSLAKQTFASSDFEWVFVDELYNWRRKDIVEYAMGKLNCHCKLIAAPKKDPLKRVNLSRSLNEATKHCDGELIVYVQDYIWIPQDGLDRFWEIYTQIPRSVVSGSGDKIACPKIDNLDGKISIFNPEITKEPEGDVVYRDWRKPNSDLQEIADPIKWEAHYASAPKSAIIKVGGWDEDFDQSNGWDNAYLAYKLQRCGYRLFIDGTNECVSIDHDKFGKMNGDGGLVNMELYKQKTQDDETITEA